MSHILLETTLWHAWLLRNDLLSTRVSSHLWLWLTWKVIDLKEQCLDQTLL